MILLCSAFPIAAAQNKANPHPRNPKGPKYFYGQLSLNDVETRILTPEEMNMFRDNWMFILCPPDQRCDDGKLHEFFADLLELQFRMRLAQKEAEEGCSSSVDERR